MDTLKYYKKPIIIEAMVYEGTMESGREIMAWLGKPDFGFQYNHDDRSFSVYSLEIEPFRVGETRVNPGDYLLKAPKGKVYIRKPTDAFTIPAVLKTYEEIN